MFKKIWKFIVGEKTVDSAVNAFSKVINHLEEVEAREANKAKVKLDEIIEAQKAHAKHTAESLRASNIGKKITALLGDDAF